MVVLLVVGLIVGATAVVSALVHAVGASKHETKKEGVSATSAAERAGPAATAAHFRDLTLRKADLTVLDPPPRATNGSRWTLTTDAKDLTGAQSRTCIALLPAPSAGHHRHWSLTTPDGERVGEVDVRIVHHANVADARRDVDRRIADDTTACFLSKLSDDLLRSIPGAAIQPATVASRSASARGRHRVELQITQNYVDVGRPCTESSLVRWQQVGPDVVTTTFSACGAGFARAQADALARTLERRLDGSAPISAGPQQVDPGRTTPTVLPPTAAEEALGSDITEYVRSHHGLIPVDNFLGASVSNGDVRLVLASDDAANATSICNIAAAAVYRDAGHHDWTISVLSFAPDTKFPLLVHKDGNDSHCDRSH
jgi:hypothetical protein